MKTSNKLSEILKSSSTLDLREVLTKEKTVLRDSLIEELKIIRGDLKPLIMSLAITEVVREEVMRRFIKEEISIDNSEKYEQVLKKIADQLKDISKEELTLAEKNIFNIIESIID